MHMSHGDVQGVLRSPTNKLSQFKFFYDNWKIFFLWSVFPAYSVLCLKPSRHLFNTLCLSILSRLRHVASTKCECGYPVEDVSHVQQSSRFTNHGKSTELILHGLENYPFAIEKLVEPWPSIACHKKGIDFGSFFSWLKHCSFLLVLKTG